MVALFSALVPLMVLFVELPLLHSKYYAFIDSRFNFNFIIAWFSYYALFAFLVSLIRELVKDMEDFEGDTAYGKHTLPVKYGIKISKIVVSILISILLIFIFYVVVKYKHDYKTIVYVLLFIVAPIIYTFWLIINAVNKDNYSKASLVYKIIMIMGLLYILVAKSFII